MFSHNNQATAVTTDGYNTAPARRHGISHHARVWPATLLALGTWVVSIAALASLQHHCPDDATTTQVPALGQTYNGLNGQCKHIFRFNWFIVSFEFALLFITLVALIMRRAYHMRVALVALFAIATVLYIYWTDQYLTAINNLPMYSDGQAKHRARTMLAGALMTAATNCFLIIALGTQDYDIQANVHTHTHIKNQGMAPTNDAVLVPVNNVV